MRKKNVKNNWYIKYKIYFSSYTSFLVSDERNNLRTLRKKMITSTIDSNTLRSSVVNLILSAPRRLQNAVTSRRGCRHLKATPAEFCAGYQNARENGWVGGFRSSLFHSLQLPLLRVILLFQLAHLVAHSRHIAFVLSHLRLVHIQLGDETLLEEQTFACSSQSS